MNRLQKSELESLKNSYEELSQRVDHLDRILNRPAFFKVNEKGELSETDALKKHIQENSPEPISVDIGDKFELLVDHKDAFANGLHAGRVLEVRSVEGRSLTFHCDSKYIKHYTKNGYRGEISLDGTKVLLGGMKQPLRKVEGFNQINQSVFEGLDEKWRFAAISDNSLMAVFNGKPERDEIGFGLSDEIGGATEYKVIDYGYDTSNWQNSLIERERKAPKTKLTGSELCKAMLARGDKYVMCIVSPYRDAIDNGSVILPKVVTKFHDYGFITTDGKWAYAVPINNQGKPLTAAEAGFFKFL